MKTLIRNVGQLVSGHVRRPLLDADSLVIDGGRIVAGGRGLDDDADSVVDAQGTTVMPGLTDSHVHPVFGDFTPRQRAVDFLDSAMHGGVTTAISAGEVHTAGDLPGISMVFIDGRIIFGRSRHTPPAARAAEVVKGAGPSAGAH